MAATIKEERAVSGASVVDARVFLNGVWCAVRLVPLAYGERNGAGDRADAGIGSVPLLSGPRRGGIGRQIDGLLPGRKLCELGPADFV